jgi:hypothetical protein
MAARSHTLILGSTGANVPGLCERPCENHDHFKLRRSVQETTSPKATVSAEDFLRIRRPK